MQCTTANSTQFLQKNRCIHAVDVENVHIFLCQDMAYFFLVFEVSPQAWHHSISHEKVKVKQSRYRPSVAQRIPGSLGSQISMTFSTWRWWGQPHAPAAFTPRKCSWYSYSLAAESTPGPWYSQKEICHWKIQWHHWESIPGPSD